MGRAYDSGSISSFLTAGEDHTLGRLMIEDSFRTEDIQKNAWRAEIQILKEQLASFPDGEIAFEFTIPRMGHRVDVVLIIQESFPCGDAGRAFRAGGQCQGGSHAGGSALSDDAGSRDPALGVDYGGGDRGQTRL